MRVPTNLRVYALGDKVELQWDKPESSGHEYEIVRYKDSVVSASEIITNVVPGEVHPDNPLKLRHFDDEDLERGRVYHYTVCHLTPGSLVRPKKPLSVWFQPSPPMAISDVKLVSLSRKQLAIDWSSYSSKVDHFEIYVENAMFRNVAQKTPKKIVPGRASSCVFDLRHPSPALHVAVVPVRSGRKVVGVTPSTVAEPWRDLIARSASINFSLFPVTQEEGKELVIELVDGVPNSDYSIIIGTVMTTGVLSTGATGMGRVTVTVPDGVGPGRHTVTLDNGAGSTVSSTNVFLIPVRLSPTPDDFVDSEPGVDITDGFDNSIIDRVRFRTTNTAEDTVSLRFRDGQTPEDFRLEICELFVHLFNGGIIGTSGPADPKMNNIVRILPSFSYPPFIHNPTSGSLNLLGLVQETRFDSMQDWVEHINEFHEYVGGMSRVVMSVTEFNPDEQEFGSAVVDIGESYEPDFTITPGRSYLIEVKEPVNNYCISADGFVTFAYMPIVKTPNGAMNYIVLVADGSFSDAEGWADEINAQHLTASGAPRVVSSIIPWSAGEQSFGEALIDTGIRYEGNFGLIDGHGYVVEVKETVSSFVLVGDSLATGPC